MTAPRRSQGETILGVPLLGGDGVDGTTVSFLLTVSLATKAKEKEEEEEQRRREQEILAKQQRLSTNAGLACCPCCREKVPLRPFAAALLLGSAPLSGHSCDSSSLDFCPFFQKLAATVGVAMLAAVLFVATFSHPVQRSLLVCLWEICSVPRVTHMSGRLTVTF